MTSKVLVYTMANCPYCTAAKNLLKQRGIPFEEVFVPWDDDAQWVALYKKSGMKTMPQIFFGEKLVGGYSDLLDLDRNGGLKDPV